MLIKQLHTRVREATWNDKSSLIDLDNRCFDYGWEDSEWLCCFKNGTITYIIEDLPKGVVTPIGFAVCSLLSDGMLIEKICIKRGYRRQGNSQKLLASIHAHASHRSWPHVVSITVPEIYLSPGDLDDVSAWIKATGFKAKPPLQPGFFTINGESVAGVPCLYEEQA